MDVSIVNVNVDTASFTVNNLNINIEYSGDITIDQDKTSQELNEKLKKYYHGYNGEELVTYPDNYIRIKGVANSDNDRQTFSSIFDLITIYFSGNANASVDFSFDYNSPFYINLYDWNNSFQIYTCEPKQGGTGYNITQTYTFDSPTEDYDLGFVGITEPSDDCDFVTLDTKVIYDFNSSSWEVEKIRFYINYDNTEISIDEGLTEESLPLSLIAKYEGVNDPQYLINFSPGQIAIEANLKSGMMPEPLSAISNLLTIYFTGQPNETVNFSFSYETPQSWCLLNDGDNCHFSTPKEIGNSPTYELTQDYTFSDLPFIGIVSNKSNGTNQGRCGSNIVPMQEGVTINFYKNDILECNPETNGDINDCKGKSLYGKAKCKMSQDPPAYLVKVEPEIDICKLNGVSTLDIVLITKHLLGIKNFKLAYQFYAADVDDNNKITAYDMHVIRNAILGIDPKPNELDFDFIPKEIFEHTEAVMNPGNFQGDCDQFIKFPINNNPQDFNFPLTAKFYGFKDGDVNNSCDNCATGGCGGEGDGDNGSHNIIVDKVKETIDSIIVTVKTTDKDSVEIIGVTLEVDPIGLELDTLVSYDAVDTVPIYNYNEKTGILKVIWQNKNAYNGISSTTDDIFTLKFRKGLNPSDFHLNLSDSIGPHYTVVSDLQYKTGLDKSKKIKDRASNLEDKFTILPTIFKDRLEFNYYSDISTKGEFSLFNNVGQLIYNKTIDIQVGNNAKVIRGLNKIPEGVVFYKLKIGDEQKTGKLIKHIF